jgi:hypothetical protein
MLETARAFDAAHANNGNVNGTANTHSDDLNAWLFGVKEGLINKTRYSVIPEDDKVAQFYSNRQFQCILNGGLAIGGGMVANNDAVLLQLTAAISAQNKAATKSNNLQCSEIHRQLSKDKSKKDRTKKIHPSILKMIAHAAAISLNDENKNLPETFIHFVNCDNVGMAQYDLVHQFKEQGFPNVAFALGNMQALFIGEFPYSDSSTSSNFTIFVFHEQEPNSNNCQQDYLICHLLQIKGQKKSLEEIKALLKQVVHVPSNYNGPRDTDPAFCSRIKHPLWH